MDLQGWTFGNLGFDTAVCCRNPATSICFNRLSGGSKAKRDRFQYWKRSLSSPMRSHQVATHAPSSHTTGRTHRIRPFPLRL